MVTSDLRAGVEMWPLHACATHPAMVIGTVRSLWTWLLGRYHMPQNIFLVHLYVAVVDVNRSARWLTSNTRRFMMTAAWRLS